MNSQTIGREPGNDIVIPDPGVSRRHARLTLDESGLAVEDLGSANGTFVNGRRVNGRRALRVGDRLRLAEGVEFVVEVEAPPAAAIAADEPVAPPATLLGDLADLDRTAGPPQLSVEVSGQPPQTLSLTGDLYTLGRSEHNDIRIASRIVSNYHARLERTPEGFRLVPLPGAVNPLHRRGRPVAEPCTLRHGDVLHIGGADPGAMVRLRFAQPGGAAPGEAAVEVVFGEKNVCRAGRDPACDVVLDAPQVSRRHAEFERVGERCRVRDLGSSNGTFVNDRRIDGAVWLRPDDTVRIGPYRFVVGADRLTRLDDSGGLRLDAAALNHWPRPDLNLLQDISLVIRPGEFVVVVGQSGGGKSTLINALAGHRPATHGRVWVNGTDVYRDFDAVRGDIGFVPQRDILHPGLRLGEALDYAARLRMPSDTSPDERRARVAEVLADLDLTHRRDVPIAGLSGGQQKRASIGVELLTKPRLFFLDEPTSGLDPIAETALMHLMRRLADQGRTIVLITHATQNVMLADKVLIVARGGHLAWFGPPAEALAHFDPYRPEAERRAHEMQFDRIYALLDDPARGAPEEWGRRYRESAAFQQHVARPLQARGLAAAEVRVARAGRPRTKRPSAWRRQLGILTARHWKILSRDRAALGLMLAAAPIVGLLDVILSLLLGRQPFSPGASGNAGNAVTSLFLLAVFGVTVGALSQMREIVKEAESYRRERLVNLEVLPYVASKAGAAALLSLYHALVYTAIHYLAFDMPGGAAEFGLFYVTLFLATLSGSMLGLFASALSPNANAAPLVVILLVLPQIVLGGALVPLPGERLWLSVPTATRWTFEGFAGITGLGADVAADACWALPPAERDSMTLDDKAARGCRCMGTAVFDPATCNFPGLARFSSPAVDEPAPVPPPPLGEPPAEPDLPERPQPPADLSDRAATERYLASLDAWQAETDQLQADYRSQVEAYQIEAEFFRAASVVYQESLMRWQVARLSAVQPAEALIAQVRRDFGWAFVDRNDSAALWRKLGGAWLAQAAILATLFAAVLALQKRKDLVS